MSTRKPAAKSSTTKTEPAAKKATAAPAPKKTLVKKTVKETATPAPVPDVELQTRLEILEQSNAELKAELLEAKTQHNTLVDKKNNLLQRAKEAITDLEKKLAQAKSEAKEFANNANTYLQPIDNDVQAVKKKVSALPVWAKWIIGIVVVALLAFAIIRAYNNPKDETNHKTTQAEVKALEKQRDSLLQDGRYYKRIAEEQAAQTAYYKKKVQEITGQIDLDNSQHEQERQNDKNKINETKNAIRHAGSDSQLIGVLTNTLRQQ